MKNSRYFGEGILVILLMILILILMIRGSVNAQTPDPLTSSNYMYTLPLTSEVPSEAIENQDKGVKTNIADDLKIFVLDEATMVEMMKQDEKIATMMIAALVRAIGNDVKLCEMIRWDIVEADGDANVTTYKEVPKIISANPSGEVGNKATCAVNNDEKACTCDCKCCKNSKS